MQTMIPSEYFTIPDQTVNHLIEDYCREPGVRSLEKYTRKILEKVAYQHVRNPSDQKINVDNPTLLKYIGLPKFAHSRFYEQTPIVRDFILIIFNKNNYREWLLDWPTQNMGDP